MNSTRLEIKHRIYNTALLHGKKKTIEKNVLKCFKNLQKISKKNHIKIITIAIKNNAPTLKMNKQKLKRKKKKMYKDVPVFITNDAIRINLALKGIAEQSKTETEIFGFFRKLSFELLNSAALKSASTIKKVENQKQILLQKKTLIRYRWGNKR